MLVLTRKKHQKIIIGDNEIIIKVMNIGIDDVDIGIEASPSWSIHRDEIFDKIQTKPIEGGRPIGGNRGEEKAKAKKWEALLEDDARGNTGTSVVVRKGKKQ